MLLPVAKVTAFEIVMDLLAAHVMSQFPAGTLTAGSDG